MSTSTPWAPTSNTFEINTNDSFHKAMAIDQYTDDRLNAAKADADILAIYNHQHPLHISCKGAYDAWDAGINTQIGSTLILNGLFDGLTDAVILWDAKIAATTGFAKRSGAFKALFPHGHAPFIGGAQADRIAAVTALSNGLVGIATLNSTKVLVDAYLLLLNNANTTQKTNIANTVANSAAVEAQRLLMCDGLYWCLGALMQKYTTNPAMIENYFYVELLRQRLQTDFSHLVKKNSKVLVLHRTLPVNQSIRFVNNGIKDLQFYYTNIKNGAPVGTLITVVAGGDVSHEISDFGAPDCSYLYAINNSPDTDGHYNVVLM